MDAPILSGKCTEVIAMKIKKTVISRAILAATLVLLLLVPTNAAALSKPQAQLWIGGTRFDATFEDNASANALMKKFQKTYTMSELNGNEKYVYVDDELPTNEKAVGKIRAGDIMLYGSDCIVIFYKSFSTQYRYTRLGRITNTAGLKAAAGSGSVKVKFVKKSAEEKIALNKTKLSLKVKGAASLKLKNARAQKVKWKSSNKKIAAVSGKGKVAAKKAGTVTITATYQNRTYKCRVTVRKASTQKQKPSTDEKDSQQGGDSALQTEQITDTGENTKPEQEAEEMKKTLTLSIDQRTVDVAWEDNAAVDALAKLAKNGPVTISMSKYGGFEQVGAIGSSLPRNDTQTTTEPGDIMLYSGNQIVVFYGSNSWSYTRLGKMTGMTRAELSELLGGGNVTLTIE